MAGHRRTLGPHLERARFARKHAARVTALKHRAKGTAKDAALKIGEALLESVPGVGLGKNLIEVGIGVFKTGRDHLAAIEQNEQFRQKNIADLVEQRRHDIYQRTLDELSGLLRPTDQLVRLPAVVFCADAQFARDGGDEGALFFLEQLWQRATAEQWQMLLVATHQCVQPWRKQRR